MDTFDWFIVLLPAFKILAAIFAIQLIYLLLVILFKKLKRNFKKKRSFNWVKGQDKLQRLRSLTPTEFEVYISDLFNKLGYKSEAVGRAYDGGIDVVATKDGITHYIQCKNFITRTVSVGDVRDFYGALANKLANGKGYFITTKFTLEAQKFAEDKPIELIDGFRLMEYIKLAERDNDSEIRTQELKCPQCGNKLIKKDGKYGQFYGCSTFPKCRYTEKI